MRDRGAAHRKPTARVTIHISIAMRRRRNMFAMVDQLIMLRAPSFDTVFQWRWQQESKLQEKHSQTNRSGLMTEQQVLRFIQYFQRITEQSLAEMPGRSQHVFQLDLDRQISNHTAI